MKKSFLSRLLTTAAAALALISAPSASNAQNTLTWNGSTSVTWATATNWDGGVAPSNSLTGNITRFNQASYSFAPTLTANTSIAGLLFDTGNTGPLLLTTGTTANRANTGASGIMMNSGSGAVTIGAATSQGLDLGADQVWTNNSGSLLNVRTISNMSNSTAYTLTLNGSGAGGILIGVGGITDGGSVGTISIVNSYGGGVTTINGTNTFTGGVKQNSGTLSLGSNGALGTGALTINGGTIDVTAARTTTNNNAQNWNGNFTFGGTNTWNTGTGVVTMNASRTVTVSASTMTVGGVVGDGGGGFSLTKEGTGALSMAPADLSKSATTTNASATVTMADTTGISIGSYVTGTGITGGTYVTAISTNASVTLSANATASGAITAAFGVANTYSGGTILNAGTLRLGSSGTTTSSALGSGVLTIGEGTKLTSASATDYYLSNNVTVGGNFTTGETGFAGELNLTGNVSLGSQDRTITAIGASLEFQGDVSGSGGIIKEGAGTISFNSNPKTFTGNLTVNNGTVIIRSNSNSIGGATKTIFMNGGALSVYGAQSLTLDNPITVGGNFGLTGNVITLRGSMDLGAADRTITTTAGGNIISGNITGSGGLIVADSFTANATAPSMFLTGDNTGWTGNLTLGATAYVSANRSQALGSGTKITLNQNSRLVTTANMTVAKDFEFSGANPSFGPQTNTTLTLNGANFTAIGGNGSGMAISLNDLGTLTLAGANTWTDDMRVDLLTGSRRLNLGNAGALNGVGIKINNGVASLDNTSGADMTLTGFKGLILTSGFTFNGTNSLDLSGGNQTGFTQTAGSSRTITVSNNTLTIAGIKTTGNFTMGNGTNSVDGALDKSGAGTLVIAGTSDYTLGTTVSAGVLQTSVATSAFGTNATVAVGGSGTLSLRNDGNVSFTNGTNPYTVTTTASGATVNVDRVSGTGNNTITIGDLLTSSTAATFVANFTGANGTSLNAGVLTTPTTASAATITLNNNIAGGGGLTLAGITAGTTNATGSTMTIGGTGNTTVSGAITQQTGAPVALTKSGAGTTLVLNGTNTYTGNTTVNAGTLLINGSTSTSGAVTVNSGGTLGGNGTVGGDTTIAAGGNLAPGNSPGILTFTGNLTLAGTTTMQINGNTARGTDFDGINVAGSLTYGGNMTLSFGTTFGVGSYTWDLFGGGFTIQPGNFTAITLTDSYSLSLNDLGSGNWGATVGNDTWSFSTSTGDLGLTVAVPEPAAWILAAFGLTTAMVFRRRKQD